MANTTQLYRQIFHYLSQYSQHCDLRHLQALSWMVSALVCSQKLSLTAWEPLCAESSAKGTELPAALEPIFEQPAHLCMASVCAVSDGSIESVGRRSIVSGARYQLRSGTNTA